MRCKRPGILCYRQKAQQVQRPWGRDELGCLSIVLHIKGVNIFKTFSTCAWPKWKKRCQSPSHVWLFASPWSITHCLAPLSMGFPRQEYWRELPFPPPGDRPSPGIKRLSHVSRTGQQVTTSTTWKALLFLYTLLQNIEDSSLCYTVGPCW